MEELATSNGSVDNQTASSASSSTSSELSACSDSDIEVLKNPLPTVLKSSNPSTLQAVHNHMMPRLTMSPNLRIRLKLLKLCKLFPTGISLLPTLLASKILSTLASTSKMLTTLLLASILKVKVKIAEVVSPRHHLPMQPMTTDPVHLEYPPIPVPV